MSFERSDSQRMDALRKANGVRTSRAKLKDDLKSGRISPTEVIARTPEYAGNMKVSEMLTAVRGFGRVKVHRLMGVCQISASKKMSGLSDRQRRELTAELQRAYTAVNVAGQALRITPMRNLSTNVQVECSERRS